MSSSPRSARRASIARHSTAGGGPRQLDTRRRFADAPPAMRILRSLAVVAIAGWLGIMAFFSFGVAPLVFRTIDRAVAGQAVAAVLPRYYDWGLVLCGMAVVACVVQVLSGREGRARPLIGGALCGGDVRAPGLGGDGRPAPRRGGAARRDRESTPLDSRHPLNSYSGFCL